LHAITGVCTPACLLAASISVEAVTPPLVGLAICSKNYFQTRGRLNGSQSLDERAQIAVSSRLSSMRFGVEDQELSANRLI
jgi:hypothetical protein